MDEVQLYKVHMQCTLPVHCALGPLVACIVCIWNDSVEVQLQLFDRPGVLARCSLTYLVLSVMFEADIQLWSSAPPSGGGDIVPDGGGAWSLFRRLAQRPAAPLCTVWCCCVHARCAAGAGRHKCDV